MDNIIEKLGIKPLMATIIQSTAYGEISSFDLEDVRKLERQRNTLLTLVVESITDNWNEYGYLYGIDHIVLGLESVTEKKWEEIKELI